MAEDEEQEHTHPTREVVGGRIRFSGSTDHDDELDIDERVVLIAVGTVTGYAIEPFDGLLTRIHKIRLTEIYPVDEAELKLVLKRARAEAKRRADEKAAREPLPGMDDDPDDEGGDS